MYLGSLTEHFGYWLIRMGLQIPDTPGWKRWRLIDPEAAGEEVWHSPDQAVEELIVWLTDRLPYHRRSAKRTHLLKMCRAIVGGCPATAENVMHQVAYGMPAPHYLNRYLNANTPTDYRLLWMCVVVRLVTDGRLPRWSGAWHEEGMEALSQEENETLAGCLSAIWPHVTAWVYQMAADSPEENY